MQLIINTFGASLRKQGEQFLVRAGEKQFAVSAHKVQSILLTTAVHLSTDAIELAVSHNIDLVFLGRDGDPFARVWQTKMGSTAAIRRRQLEVAEGAEGLALVREWVEAKLRHQEEFLEELWRRRPGADDVFQGPLATLRGCLSQVRGLGGGLDEQRGTLMGLEGSAGRAYFGCLGRLVPEAYRFEGRSRHPARDGFNGMLNYSYGVLYSLVEKACICAGLDPHVGFLHTDNYNKRSLVFDLIEPFRVLGDRAVLVLFTGRRVQQDHFERVPGGVALSKDGRAFFLAQFNERLDQRVRYPVQGRPRKRRNVKVRDTIQHEAHALANRLLGKHDMPRVVETRQLWAEPGAGGDPLPDDDAGGPDESAPTTPRGDAVPQEPGCIAAVPPAAGRGDGCTASLDTAGGGRHADLGGVRHLEGQDADEGRPSLPGLRAVPGAEERVPRRRAREPRGGNPAVHPGFAGFADGFGLHLSNVPGGLRPGADRRPRLRSPAGGGQGADAGDLIMTALQTEFTVNVVEYRLRFPRPLAPGEASQLRGYCGTAFADEVLLHHHNADGSLRYDYPRVQFKVLDYAAHLIGLAEGADLVTRLWGEVDAARLGTEELPVLESTLARRRELVGEAAEAITYRLRTPWLGLNQDNHRAYEANPDPAARRALLARVLVGNCLSLAKAFGYRVSSRLSADGAGLRPWTTRLKGVLMRGFVGTFRVNFHIPDRAGVGKSVSRGFGTVERAREEQPC
jgi:CRISPR-associated protein Cas1